MRNCAVIKQIGSGKTLKWRQWRVLGLVLLTSGLSLGMDMAWGSASGNAQSMPPSTSSVDDNAVEVVPALRSELGLLRQAQTAFREERYPEAELLWRELVRQWPDSAELSYSLGMTLHRQFKLEEAAQAYVTAAVLNPNHREAYINLSLARIQLGQGEEALEPLAHVLNLPDRPSKPASIHAMAHYNRAIVLGRQGKLEESRQAVDAALAIAPNFREAKELIDLIR